MLVIAVGRFYHMCLKLLDQGETERARSARVVSSIYIYGRVTLMYDYISLKCLVVTRDAYLVYTGR